MRLADVDDVVRTLRTIAAAPTVPYHEERALAVIASELSRDGIERTADAYGQIVARVGHGRARRPLVMVAHADHPGFEVIDAADGEGTARILGGFRGPIRTPTPVRVYPRRGDGDWVRATVDGFVPVTDRVHHSPGHVRMHTEAPLAPGDWAVLDLPSFEVDGDDIHMAAADDLAGCAVAICALREIARERIRGDVRAVFTRAEETGLHGARLIAEAGTLPRDAVVISIEASRALPHAPPGSGVVVRVGDRENTFSNDAEAYLRSAAERLAVTGLRTQRALLDGGTCEASAFVLGGWAASAIALPNVNYHNRGPDGGLTCEVVRLDDVRSAIALMIATAQAVGSDDTPLAGAGPVDDEVRALLRRGAS